MQLSRPTGLSTAFPGSPKGTVLGLARLAIYVGSFSLLSWFWFLVGLRASLDLAFLPCAFLLGASFDGDIRKLNLTGLLLLGACISLFQLLFSVSSGSAQEFWRGSSLFICFFGSEMSIFSFLCRSLFGKTQNYSRHFLCPFLLREPLAFLLP